MSQYWIGRDGQQYGPFDEGALRSGFTSGKLLPTDLVWKEGLSEWVPAASVFGPPAAAPAPAASATPPAPAAAASAVALTAPRESHVGSGSSVDYGLFLLGVPVAATLLVWFWVGSMNLFQSPSDSLALITVATIVATAVLAAVEASKVGMATNRAEGTYSPVAWFFILALLWIVGYPLYLFKRRRYGLKNLLAAGVAVALVFVASTAIMGAAIDAKKDELRQGLQEMERGLRDMENAFRSRQR